MTIYTDGACKENNRNEGVAEGEGGWAFLILESKPGQDMKIIGEGSGYVSGTTNQEMEIMALAEALESIKSKGHKIDLYSDSAYVVNCLNDQWYVKWRKNGWKNSKGKPVENRDQWERMLSLFEKHEITVYHVKRNTTKFIRLVDSMAKKAAKKGTNQEQK